MEAVFSEYEGVDAISCGTNNDAETPLSGDLIEWLDIILVMENSHKKKVSKKYQNLLKDKRLVCLDIADNYEFMQAELVKLLQEKVAKYL
ncbi:MAG: phosphotyrosine protein phosphatase [Methylococcales bacterium]|nr:phosphotyrosine protein phosphatase [Methylococcales bacterium]